MQGDATFLCSFYVSRGFWRKRHASCGASKVSWVGCCLGRGPIDTWGVRANLGVYPLASGPASHGPCHKVRGPGLLLYPYALAIALGPTPRDHRAVNFLLHGRKKFSRFSGRVKITSARNHCAFRRGTVAANAPHRAAAALAEKRCSAYQVCAYTALTWWAVCQRDWPL